MSAPADFTPGQAVTWQRTGRPRLGLLRSMPATVDRVNARTVTIRVYTTGGAMLRVSVSPNRLWKV
jgi:hypothetical protein